MVLTIFFCLLINASQCSSSLFKPIGGLLIMCMIPLIVQLNSSVAELGRPGTGSVDLICNKAICGSDLVSRNF